MENIKVLDLYSGIGGLHYSMLQALINCVHERTEKGTLKGETGKEHAHNCGNLFNDTFRFISIDLNYLANQTHYHNFEKNSIYLTEKKYIDKFFKECQEKRRNHGGRTPEGRHNAERNNIKEVPFVEDKNYILQTDINNLDAQFLDYHKFFILLISNPCQPYTRQNKKFQQINLDELFRKYAYSTTGESSVEEKKKEKGSFPSSIDKMGHINNLFTPTCGANVNSDTDDKVHLVTEKCNVVGGIPFKWENKKNVYDQVILETLQGGDQFHVDKLNLDEALRSLEIEKDERSRSFIHICNLLKNVKEENLPKYIFIENVRNFELSTSFFYFINSVKENYNFQTYLLSPLQYGIPNERLRFYCICRRKHKLADLTSGESFTSGWTTSLYSNSLMPAKCIMPAFENNANFRPSQRYSFYTPSLATFLDHNEKYEITCNTNEEINLTNGTLEEYQVSNSTLEKCSSFCFDMIDINRNGNVCCFEGGRYYVEKSETIKDLPNEKNLKDLINSNNLHSMCFTSNYGRYINGSGSVLYFSRCRRGSPSSGTERGYENTQNEHMGKARMGDHPSRDNSCRDYFPRDYFSQGEIIEEMSKYKNRVRYFTPVEICRLMGYKMHTSRPNTEDGENKRNRVGNIYWNMDHINHMCAYTCNVHYCASRHSDTCLFNGVLPLAQNSVRKSPNDGVCGGGESRDGNSKDERTAPCSCHEFKFPPFLTNRQKYKLVGNSVNVTVISLIFQAHDIFGDLLKGESLPS
ncbi:DNA (cytosine-5)-methyltransferase, putative [Plasmodium knowlesi strain H]|uniref:DNA (Cytosine-5)-methyltransferase, putative n=3 Tax=Plasmodium knowlesi TaxID=5850 RepID=A0A5K1UHG0_PLAKH|nr:DNA (cytosine-5)-methyltransferase, putative [Plasmodium knowlesi strain H]OTN66307.1 putative DNA (Cytosine-5)-methyltransferase [Plasmodium knowlesi]CAA9986385.1 DNA (cytosine-5)-methyltransferase, putative [Plasmodium knowlesi strain H]SBO25652.1 DNA (cytosine-5)-methyltransferase, putative [Plasmodium knowlesi strain H]SBO28370.1 DNA (cytosine-5)-methyltransferase, putative [Plasmodium knowlesi strain H]VVS75859.1 DNA (cytosine-5)-methyltransferase, putative [Plasmodium knowlesi strain |eukprot:XP_002257791.1 modification methylase-like protein, putative [Plasmodium knowlesi strain H]